MRGAFNLSIRLLLDGDSVSIASVSVNTHTDSMAGMTWRDRNWEELIAEWEHWAVKRRGRRTSYARGVATRLRRAGREIGTTTPPTVQQVDAWMAGQTWSAKTSNNAVAAFRGFGRWLELVHGAAPNPYATLQTTDDDGDRAWELTSAAFETQHVHELIRVSRELYHTDARHRTPRWVQYALQAYLGLRNSEAAYYPYKGNPDGGVCWHDLDLGAGTLRLRGSVAKVRNASTLPLHPYLAAILAEYRAGLAKDPLPTDRIVPSGTRVLQFRADLVRCGIPRHAPNGQPYSMTSFRKWFATQLSISGIDPIRRAELMRHSSIRTTERHYVDHDRIGLREAVCSLPGLGTRKSAESSTKSAGSAPQIPDTLYHQPTSPVQASADECRRGDSNPDTSSGQPVSGSLRTETEERGSTAEALRAAASALAAMMQALQRM